MSDRFIMEYLRHKKESQDANAKTNVIVWKEELLRTILLESDQHQSLEVVMDLFEML